MDREPSTKDDGLAGRPPQDRAATDPYTQVLETEAAGSRLIRGTALRTVGLAFGIALSVGSTALLTRHLGVADYGRYLTIISLLVIVAGLSEAGLDNIGVREYTSLRARERDRAMESLVGIRLLLAAAGTAVAVGFAVVAYDSTMAVGALLGGIGIVALTLSGALSVQLFSSLRLGWVAAAELVRQTLLVLTITALVVAGAGLLPFLASTIPAHLGMLVMVLLLVRGKIRWRPRFNRQEWRRLLRIALPFAVATAAGIVYYRVAIILMSLIASNTEVGYFGASFRVVEVLVVIPPLFATSAFPILARSAMGAEVRFRYAVGRMFEVALLGGAGLALIVVIGAPIAIGVIGGSQFDPSIELLRIQGLVLLSTFVIATSAYALLALRRYRAILLANVVAVMLVATLTLALVPGLDATGAAIAMAVSEIALACVSTALLLRGGEARFPLRAAAKVTLATGLAAATLLVPGIPVLADLAIATAVYIAVVALTRAIPPEIWNALAPWRPDIMEP